MAHLILWPYGHEPKPNHSHIHPNYPQNESVVSAYLGALRAEQMRHYMHGGVGC